MDQLEIRLNSASVAVEVEVEVEAELGKNNVYGCTRQLICYALCGYITCLFKTS